MPYSHANHNESSSFFDIEPFIDGSNQEWAMEMLSMFDNNDEKIRLYSFLLHAYTYLMKFDEQDFLEEYYFVKELWLKWLRDSPNETAEEQESHRDIEQIIEDEGWVIDIFYPLERPFTLTSNEFIDVFFVFVDANPQFLEHPMFADMIIPVTHLCEVGISPGITIFSYWAFADRRQEAYQHFINTFDPIPWQPGRHFDGWDNHPPVIIDVFPVQRNVDDPEELVITDTWKELQNLEDAEGLEDNSDSFEDYENHQNQENPRRNLILFSTLGAFLLLATTILVAKGKRGNQETEILEEVDEHKEQEQEVNTDSMITINCDFCGARVNVIKGKSQKCPYCDCIISVANGDQANGS